MKAKKESSWQQIAEEVNLSESYKSLLLGVGVILVLGALFIGFFGSRQQGLFNAISPLFNSKSQQATPSQPQKQEMAKPQETDEPTPGMLYKVKEGEYLYDIAVRAYGDGDRWQDIVKANNFPNPDYVAPGTVITIPR